MTINKARRFDRLMKMKKGELQEFTLLALSALEFLYERLPEDNDINHDNFQRILSCDLSDQSTVGPLT